MYTGVTSGEAMILLDAFTQQAECYASMLKISRRERHLIESRFTMSEWKGLLAQRCGIMAEINRIESHIAFLKDKWRTGRRKDSQPLESQVRIWLVRIERLVSDLIEADRENERRLSQRMPSLSPVGGVA